VGRAGLEGVEQHLGQRVAERRAVAGQDDGRPTVIVFERRGLGGQVFAGFLVRLVHQRGKREGFLRAQRIAGEEAHLIQQARHAPDAVGQGRVERGAELGVLPFVGQQLLVGGQRDHGIADFMRQAVGHGFDQAQFGRLDFEVLQLFALREVFRHEQRRGRQAGRLPLERDNADAVDRARRVFPLEFEAGDRGAGPQDLIHLGAEGGRQVAELQLPARARGAAAEVADGRLVGVEDGQVPADDHARAAEFAQDFRHDFVVGGQLVVEPDVLDGQPQLFEQVEDQLQLGVHEGLAGDAPVEDRHPQQRLPVQDRHGHLRPQQLELIPGFGVMARLLAVAPQDAAEAQEVSADAAFERQLEVVQQAARDAEGARRVQAPAFGLRGGVAEGGERRAQEDGRAVKAENLAQQQEELLQHALGVQRVRQDA